MICIESEIKDSKKILDTFYRQYEKLTTWEGLYDNSDLDAKKMIVGQIIQAVKVRSGYELEIDMNITFEQFGFNLQAEDNWQKREITMGKQERATE